jgi:hypothetical protein
MGYATSRGPVEGFGGISAPQTTPTLDHCQQNFLDQERLTRLEDETFVAGTAGDLLAVEVFEKGDGVLA